MLVLSFGLSYFVAFSLTTCYYHFNIFTYQLTILLSFAYSVSSLMTTTEAVVSELPKDEKDVPAMAPGMGMDY